MADTTYKSIHKGAQIDDAVTEVLNNLAGIQGVKVDDTELTPDTENKVNIDTSTFNIPVVVQETGTSETDVMSQNAVTTAINAIDIPEVVQQTGTSIETVMSQNAVTNAIGDLVIPAVVQELGQSQTSVVSQKGITDSILNTELESGNRVKINSDIELSENAENVTLIDGKRIEIQVEEETMATKAGSNTVIIGGAGAWGGGDDNVFIGKDTSGSGDKITAIGARADGGAPQSVAIGADCVGSVSSVVVGSQATIDPPYSYAGVAIGAESKGGPLGVAVGKGSQSGQQAIAIGSGCKSGERSVTIGTDINNTGTFNVAIGALYSSTLGSYSVSIGYGAGDKATGDYSACIGFGGKASGSNSLSLGYMCNAEESRSIAIGDQAISDAENGIAIGTVSKATGDNSVAAGYATEASGENSIALGSNCVVSGENSIALGSNCSVSGENSVVIGPNMTDGVINTVQEDNVIEISGRRITGVTDPINAQDAATKNYVDTNAAPLESPAFTGIPTGILQTFSVTLPYTDWTGSSAPYTKEVTVAGILSTDKPDINLDLSTATYSDVATIQSDWANVYRGVTSADTITFYASTVPTIDIPLQIKVVR